MTSKPSLISPSIEYILARDYQGAYLDNLLILIYKLHVEGP